MSGLHTRGYRPSPWERDALKLEWLAQWSAVRSSRGWSGYELEERGDPVSVLAADAFDLRCLMDPMLRAKWGREAEALVAALEAAP